MRRTSSRATGPGTVEAGWHPQEAAGRNRSFLCPVVFVISLVFLRQCLDTFIGSVDATLIGAALLAASLSVSFSAQARELSVSTVLSDAFPWGQAAEKWAELVEERTEGRLTLRVYPNSRGPISEPADLDGLKIRVVGSPLFQGTSIALGTDPTQMSWTDALPALTTGAVDGQENPLSVFDVARIDQAGQAHLALWNYMNDPLIFAVNRLVWESLDEADREILRETAVEAGQWEIAMTREEESERLAAIQERGVEVTELTEEQYAAFAEATAGVHEKWVPRIGEAIVEAARTAVEAR